MKAPVLFISHGAPTFAIEPGILGAHLRRIGESLTGIRAVLIVSPHWQTQGFRVTTAQAPETIHDFGGFPEALYQLRYPAPGEPSLAREVIDALARAGATVEADARRGFDHGAWVPLMHLLPAATVPVVQLSMPYALDAAVALQLGAVLAGLREQGVLIIGSGSLTHNLQDVFQGGGREPSYAPAFVEWMRDVVQRRDADALAHYRSRAPHAVRAHPTDEHLLPLMVAFGASDERDALSVVEGGMSFRILSMESYGWGLPAA